MSEIEKLYDNANIKPKPLFRTRYGYEEGNYIMPVFTAEKQLSLIKWLAKRRDFALDYYPSCNIWVAKTEFCWEYYEKTYEHKETKNALAGLINTLWQDLTDTEKGEIRRILE